MKKFSVYLFLIISFSFSPFFSVFAEELAVASPSPTLTTTIETSPTPDVSEEPTSTPTPTPTPEEPALSEVISQQVMELKDSLKTLSEIKEAAKTDINIKNEVAIRQVALFKIIDISLNENSQTLKTISQIENLDANVLAELRKVVDADNKWYQKILLKINTTNTSEELKSLALQIKSHREEVRGLSIRRLVGLILVLQELSAISTAQERAAKIQSDLENINSSVRPILGAELERAMAEIDTAYQLAKSSQLRLENMANFDDFEYSRDWLERANDSLKSVYSIFESIAEKAK